MYDDQGSGELERAGAKGSSNGFSSKAREDCCKRSSKPDMIASLRSKSLRHWPSQAHSHLIHIPTAIFQLTARCRLTYRGIFIGLNTVCGLDEADQSVLRHWVHDSSYSLQNGCKRKTFVFQPLPLPRYSFILALALSSLAGLSSTSAIRRESGEGSCLRAMSRNQSLPI